MADLPVDNKMMLDHQNALPLSHFTLNEGLVIMNVWGLAKYHIAVQKREVSKILEMGRIRSPESFLLKG